MANPNKKGNLIVLSAVSGAGKTTIANHLVKRDRSFVRSVSVTTRRRHPNEREGIDYYFVSQREFDDMIKNDMFLQYQLVHSHYYGTPKKYVVDNISKGKNVILVIDTKGGLNIKKMFADAILIFILPPSLQDLIKRLNLRGRESAEEIERRIKNGKEELRDALNYDYIVINDDIERAIQDIIAIVRVNNLTTKRNRDKVIKIMKEYEV
ncbi:MAG: guanylate kinase [Deltaproteobacteria bacterium]|nr:guanylate kinase [Deltaproteobacteria bacterium]